LILCEQHSSSSRVASIAGKTLEHKEMPSLQRRAAEGNDGPFLVNQIIESARDVQHRYSRTMTQQNGHETGY